MTQERIEIEATYPTTKFKKFWYPTRPLFTLGLGIFLVTLGVTGVLPMSWAWWAAGAFAFDDLPFTPMISMLTAVNNLVNGRKKLKAIVMITAISLATIFGGVWALLVLTHSPAFMAGIALFVKTTECSPILMSIGAIIGSLIAHSTHKISPFIGIGLGVTVASFIPFSVIPLMVEAVFITAAGCAFLSSIVAKQGLRYYFKYRYGHSNADGYAMDCTQEEKEQIIQQQATKFNMQPVEFERNLTVTREKIAIIKQKSTIYSEFMGKRQSITNSFKDIYHGLMNPKPTTAEQSFSIMMLLETKALYSSEPTYKRLLEAADPMSVDINFFSAQLMNPRLTKLRFFRDLHSVKLREGYDLAPDESVSVITYLNSTS